MHSRFPPVYIYCRFGSHCVNLLSLLYASMSLCPVSTIVVYLFLLCFVKNTVGSFFLFGEADIASGKGIARCPHARARNPDCTFLPLCCRRRPPSWFPGHTDDVWTCILKRKRFNIVHKRETEEYQRAPTVAIAVHHHRPHPAGSFAGRGNDRVARLKHASC